MHLRKGAKNFGQNPKEQQFFCETVSNLFNGACDNSSKNCPGEIVSSNMAFYNNMLIWSAGTRTKKFVQKDLDIDTFKFTHGLYPALEGIYHCPAPSCGC